MFKTPISGILFGASKVSTKLFVPSSGLHATASMKLKEIHSNKVGNKLIIQGAYTPSPRKDHLIQNNGECCPLCNLGLDVKHTDVLILSQFVRPDGCMMPQRITGLCKTQQKKMSKLVSMAHKAGLMCNLAPENSKKDPTKRKLWKKYNTYFDESTIKVYESHFKKIKENSNPATWILDITSKSSEDKLVVDLAQIYKESTLFKENNIVIEQMKATSSGSEGVISSSRYAQTGWEQFKVCLWKQNLSYWRNPSYNLTRIIFMCITSLLCGILFWQKAKHINNQQDLFNIFGSMFTVVLFSGINNCSTVLFCVATERNVFYRERFARMYTSWAYSLAQVLIEIPYSLFQSIVYVIIVYPMVGYQWSVHKVVWSFYTIFCSLLIFNYFGMLLVVVTPNIHVAFTLRSSLYSIVNLFAGYVMPKPNIPRWWIWMYYLSPTSWVLNGLLTSQYGDMEKEILAFGEKKKVSAFLEDYFGYKYDSLALVATLLIAFPILLAFLFAFCIGKLNFQKK